MISQLELRYSAGAYAPYIFYDAGSVTTNTNPWAVTATANERKIAGLGAALAWRTEGGAASV